MPKVYARKDDKCPYCKSDNYVQVADRRPNQDLVQCANSSCAKYFVIMHGNKSFPLLDPSDSTSPPSHFVVVN